MGISRWFSRRTEFEREMSEEIRDHVERQASANLSAGMSPREARRQALAKFGAIEGVKEDCREERRGFWLETLWTDVRYGMRVLRKNSGFSGIAVLTLALGIGASTAVFSLVNAILLKPLPYPNQERVLMIWNTPPAGVNLGFDEMQWGRVEYLFLEQRAKTFEAFAAFKSDSFNLTGAGDPARLDGIRAASEFFSALGVGPVLGRTFTADEDREGYDHEVILSYPLWRDRFGGDPGILGRVLELNGAAYTVIGVMPAAFAFPHGEEMPAAMNFPRDVRIWVPLALNRGPLIPAEPWELAVVARMRAGVTSEQARTEMKLLMKRLEDQYPREKGWLNARLVPIARQAAGDTQRPLILLLSAAGVVLLIACCNVASLLLARSLARQREFTLRAALGAAPGRLIRQLLTESLLLSCAGGVLGVAFGEVGIRFAKLFGPKNLPRLSDVSLDFRVLAFAIGITLVTGILLGLAPALATGRGHLMETLKRGDQRSGAVRDSGGFRKALLISEVALAFVLVVAAGLLVQTFFRLLSVDPGFRAARVLTFELSLPDSRYADQPHIVALYQDVLRRLRALPGVQGAGIVDVVPMSGATQSTGIRIPGHPATVPQDQMSANYTMISPGYLVTVGTPILRGRDIQESDSADSMPVAVISASMATKFWPGEDPLGKQVGPGSTKYPAGTIVGIAADVKHLSLSEESIPEMYVPYTQKVWPSLLTMDVAVRTTMDPASVMTAVREAVRSVDADLPLAKAASLQSLVDDSMANPRFLMLLLASFGGLALLLASVGMYGVISYSVERRTQEIGIRIALGAQRRSVLGMVLGQGARLTGIGIGAGMVTTLGVTRLMASFLYGVRPTDAATFAGVALFLAGVAVVACYIPARRAMRIDPLTALRYE
jgi:predicted permease